MSGSGREEASGLLPGTEGRWSALGQMRAPYDRAVAELRNGDGASFALVVRFLTDRPRFHGSGYLTERMLRYVDRVSLSDAERSQLVAVAEVIAEGHTREAREARLLLVRLGGDVGGQP
jgi:hypothetical protein